MAKISLPYCKVSKFKELKKVGKNNTSLAEFELMEPISRKQDDGSYKTVGHNFFEATIWGEDATKAAMELSEGVTLDLSPTIEQGENGPWVKYQAELKDNSWEYEGKTYHKAIVNIFSYKIRD